MWQDKFLQILLPFDQWATTQLILASRLLTPEQFYAPFNIGPGSLHNVITHILGTMRTWTETLSALELTVRIDFDGIYRTPDQLLKLNEQICLAFQKEADRLPIIDISDRKLRSGRIIQLTRCEILTHVTTHCMHHRAQGLNMLRQLGVKPLPPSSIVEWRMLQESSK